MRSLGPFAAVARDCVAPPCGEGLIQTIQLILRVAPPLILAAAALACATLTGPPRATLPAPVQWRRDIGTEAISPPAVVDDLLIYKESVSAIVARSAGDGAEKWRHPIAYAPSLFRPLAVAGGRVFVDDSTVDSTNQ